MYHQPAHNLPTLTQRAKEGKDSPHLPPSFALMFQQILQDPHLPPQDLLPPHLPLQDPLKASPKSLVHDCHILCHIYLPIHWGGLGVSTKRSMYIPYMEGMGVGRFATVFVSTPVVTKQRGPSSGALSSQESLTFSRFLGGRCDCTPMGPETGGEYLYSSDWRVQLELTFAGNCNKNAPGENKRIHTRNL